MKNHRLVLLTAVLSLLAATVILAQPGLGRRGGGRGYWQMYNPQNVETLQGKVLSVDRITMAKGQPDGIQLSLSTANEIIPVHLGPVWFIDNQEEKIFEEDQIEITGSRITYQGKPAILAATVQKGDQLLTLRDDQGFPLWRGWRQGKNATRPRMGKMANRQNRPCTDENLDFGTAEVIQGKVIAVERVDAKMGNWKGIHLLLQTEKEQIAVHLGPEWYMSQQEAVFAVGDQLKVTGARATVDDKPALFAAQVTRGDDSWILRDELGLPAWRGWRKGAVQ